MTQEQQEIVTKAKSLGIAVTEINGLYDIKFLNVHFSEVLPEDLVEALTDAIETVSSSRTKRGGW